MNESKLRAAIYGKYKSAAACADSIGWSRQKMNNIINGRKIPNVNEIKLIAEAIQLSNSDLMDIFFASAVTSNVTRQSR